MSLTALRRKLSRTLTGQQAKAISLHSVRDYRKLVRDKLREHPGNRELALAQSIGAVTMAVFHDWGDRQVAVLRHHGLTDGMTVYDLGCGCGRTAQALQRSGWQGSYRGADIVAELTDELVRTCPGYEALVHRELTIAAPDASVDILFHWSVFTHLYPEECYVYMLDIFRALKPGGKLVFSFLEMGDPLHDVVFDGNVSNVLTGTAQTHLNQFLHRDWISHFAAKIGFTAPQFTDGSDDANHPPFGQALAAMNKPAA